MSDEEMPADQFFLLDEDMLQWTDLVEAIGAGAQIPPDDPMHRVTASTFSFMAEAAVEQHTPDLPKGKVQDFRNRTLWLTRSVIAEQSFATGRWFELSEMWRREAISQEMYTERLREHALWATEIRRRAAFASAVILKDVQNAVLRKGSKGRPPQSRSGDWIARSIDKRIVFHAYLATERKDFDRAAVARQIPHSVREFLRTGQLGGLGETTQEAVDRHAKRIRKVMDDLVIEINRHGRLRGASLGSKSISRTS